VFSRWEIPIVAAISLAATLLLPACSSLSTASIRIGDTRAARIAKDTTIPGKGVPGQCLPFANALQEKLEAAGIPSKVIVYGYEASAMPQAGATQPGDRGSHAVVAYEDSGRTYIMDNQSWTPQWVHDGPAIQMAQRFSGIYADVKVARVVRDSSLQLTPSEISPTVRLAAE